MCMSFVKKKSCACLSIEGSLVYVIFGDTKENEWAGMGEEEGCKFHCFGVAKEVMSRWCCEQDEC